MGLFGSLYLMERKNVQLKYSILTTEHLGRMKRIFSGIYLDMFILTKLVVMLFDIKILIIVSTMHSFTESFSNVLSFLGSGEVHSPSDRDLWIVTDYLETGLRPVLWLS